MAGEFSAAKVRPLKALTLAYAALKHRDVFGHRVRPAILLGVLGFNARSKATIRRRCQRICGLYRIASRTPRAAEGVMIGYDKRSTFNSGRVNKANSPHTLTETRSPIANLPLFRFFPFGSSFLWLKL